MTTVICAYIADGYLAAAMTGDDWDGGMQFPGEIRDEENYHAVRVDVPSDLAADLCNQGTSGQAFSDGYDAADAVAEFVGPDPEIVDGEMIY